MLFPVEEALVGDGWKTSSPKNVCVGGQASTCTCTRILVRAMIGLLKEPLPIYQSFCKEIRNTWNIHINEILKKASKRIYFLVQLKRAKVTRRAPLL